MNRRRIFIVLIAIIGLIVVTVTATYAFFNYAKTGTTDNVIRSKSITFHYDEVSKIGAGISITDALPMDEVTGKAQTNYFDFKITSDTASNIAIPYTVTVRKKDNSTLNENSVKMYLVDKDSNNELSYDYYANLTKYNNLDDERVIYSGRVPTGQTNYEKNFRLRMWIAEVDKNGNTIDYADEAYNNKSFTVTVNVYSEGTVLTDSQIDLESSTGISSITASIGNIPVTVEEVSDESYQYAAEVPEGTDNININVETENPNSEVSIEKVDSITYNDVPTIRRLSTSNSFPLEVGDNFFKITVISENGRVTDKYFIKIVRVVDVNPPTYSYRYNSSNSSYYITLKDDSSGLQKYCITTSTTSNNCNWITLTGKEQEVLLSPADYYKNIFVLDNKNNQYSGVAYITSIKLTKGNCYSYNKYGYDCSSDAQTYLFDGIYSSRQGRYGALWLSAWKINDSSSDYLEFTVYEKIQVSFSSNTYSDSGGSSGKVANFYKIDGNNNQTLYYSLTQLNTTYRYGSYEFIPGKYILKAANNYVVFDEWHITSTS